MKLGFFSVAILTGARVHGTVLTQHPPLAERGGPPKPHLLSQADLEDVKVSILPHYGHAGQEFLAPSSEPAKIIIPQKVRLPPKEEETGSAKEAQQKAEEAQAAAEKAQAAAKAA